MVTYAEFYNENKRDLIGSDSVCIVDGRKTINNQIDDAIFIVSKKKRVMYPFPTYLRLFTGSIREPHFITDYVKIYNE